MRKGETLVGDALSRFFMQREQDTARYWVRPLCEGIRKAVMINTEESELLSGS